MISLLSLANEGDYLRTGWTILTKGGSKGKESLKSSSYKEKHNFLQPHSSFPGSKCTCKISFKTQVLNLSDLDVFKCTLNMKERRMWSLPSRSFNVAKSVANRESGSTLDIFTFHSYKESLTSSTWNRQTTWPRFWEEMLRLFSHLISTGLEIWTPIDVSQLLHQSICCLHLCFCKSNSRCLRCQFRPQAMSNIFQHFLSLYWRWDMYLNTARDRAFHVISALVCL